MVDNSGETMSEDQTEEKSTNKQNDPTSKMTGSNTVHIDSFSVDDIL
jgi:hypothetical protein